MTAALMTPISINQALGPRFFAEQDRLRGGPAPELCAPSYRARIGGNPVMDRVGHEYFATSFYGAFDGLHHTVDDVVADESHVVVRFTIRGTQTGPFFGIPNTGKAIEVGAIAILRVESGLVTKLDAIFDEAGMLRQLGVLPSG